MNRLFVGIIGILLLVALCHPPVRAGQPTTRPSVFDNPEDLKKLVETFADKYAKLQQENIDLKAQMKNLIKENSRLRAQCDQMATTARTDFKLSEFFLAPATQPQTDVDHLSEQLFLDLGSTHNVYKVQMNIEPWEAARLRPSADLIDDRVKAKGK